MLNPDFIARKGNTKKDVVERLVQDAWTETLQWVPKHDHLIDDFEDKTRLEILLTDGNHTWSRATIQFEEQDGGVQGTISSVSGGGTPDLSRRQRSEVGY